MTIKVERDVVLGWNLAQYGILWYEGVYGQGETPFCLRQVLASCSAANRKVFAMHPALASRGGALAGHALSVPQIA